MVMLATPEAPATSRQLWLLHILTKQDTRNLKLTMQQASDKISELKTSKPEVKPQTTAEVKPVSKPIPPGRVVIQGKRPNGQTDIASVLANFKASPSYAEGRKYAGNDTADIGIYEFQCKECLFGCMGICKPKWYQGGSCWGHKDKTCHSDADYIAACISPNADHCENVSYSCQNFEPVEYRPDAYCNRPKGKQCQRKHVDNKCLECQYRCDRYTTNIDRHIWYSYIPTMQERITKEQKRNMALNITDSEVIDILKSINEGV